MKYIHSILIAVTLIFGMEISAQVSFEIGPTVGLNSTWIINPNTLITHQELTPELTLTPEVGATTLLKFSKRFGFGAGISSGEFAQKYDWNADTSSFISLKTVNIPIFLHFGNRFYNETGIQFTAYDKALITIQDELEEDVESAFSQNNLYLFTGIGYSIHFTKHVFLNLGLRFGYGLEDLMGVSPQGYDYEGLDEYAAFINAGNMAEDFPEHEEYEEYSSYFENAEDFANTYEKLNKTYGLYATFMGSLVINLQKFDDKD